MNEIINKYLNEINKSIEDIDDQELFNEIIFGYATSNNNINADPITVSWDIKYDKISISEDVYPGRTIFKHSFQPEVKLSNSSDFKKVTSKLKEGLIESFRKDSLVLMIEEHNPFDLITSGRISYDFLLEGELLDVLTQCIDQDINLYFNKAKIPNYEKSVAKIILKNIQDESQYEKLGNLLNVEVTYNLLLMILNEINNVKTKLLYSISFIKLIEHKKYKLPVRCKKQVIELFDFITSTTDFEKSTAFSTLQVLIESMPSIKVEMTVDDISELEKYLDLDLSIFSIAIVNKDSLNLLFNKSFYEKDINLEFEKLIVNNEDESTFELLISSLGNFIEYIIASETDDQIIHNAIFVKESLMSISTVNSVKNKKFIRIK